MNGFKKIGTGPHKVLALHGWFGDENFLDPISAAIDTDRFEYAVMAFRGYGASKALQGRYTLEEIAQDAITLADKLGWQTFSLLGHSMGGKAAQRVLVDASNRVRKIVAVAPAPAQAVPFDDATWQLFEGAAANEASRFGIIDFSTGNRLSRAWVKTMTKHSLESSREDAFAGYLDAWAKADFADQVKGNRVPVKVIVGANDPSITQDVINATYVPLYPNCEVTVVENAGHYPVDEIPAFLAAEIEAFLAS